MEEEKRVTYRSLRDEREYGFYWYSGLWRILRPLLVGLTVAVIVCGLSYTAYNRIYGAFFAPVDPEDAGEVSFEIASGDSLNRVAGKLEGAELIRSRTVFKYYCDFAGMAQKIQVGTYALRKDMAMTEIAERLTAGDGNPMVRNITLIPGETVEAFAAKMVREGVLAEAETFLNLCRTGEAFRDYYYIADMLAAGRASSRKYALEGYLAPNTYEIYTTAKPEEIIRKLLSQTEAAFPSEDQERAEALGMTMDQVLTLASLIEKEAGEGDFARVSAVFHNRLKAKMRLDSDVTIHYITGVRKMALSEADLKLDSPYNTYRNTGLPVGPICNPSVKAIQAALYPDEGMIAENYLYFCAKEPESGELYFSRTLAEHERAVSVYAPLWQQYDRSRGIE